MIGFQWASIVARAMEAGSGLSRSERNQDSSLHPNFVGRVVRVPRVFRFAITDKTRKKNFDD